MLIPLCLMLVAEDNCGTNESESDKQQRAQQEAISQQGNAQVGMPGITKFTEKRLVRQLYEKRDMDGVLTFTYITDMQGRLWHVCDSIGYGLPYGVQFSNPERPYEGRGSWGYAMPQPEPNGLFMPPGAEGTWVQCIGDKGKTEPMYIEPRVIVSPWKLNAAGSYR